MISDILPATSVVPTGIEASIDVMIAELFIRGCGLRGWQEKLFLNNREKVIMFGGGCMSFMEGFEISMLVKATAACDWPVSEFVLRHGTRSNPCI